MQATNLWNQFHLHWRKIVLLFFITVCFSFSAFSQARFNAIHTSGQDDKRISYGFFLAGHTSTFNVKYSERFLDQSQDRVTNISPAITQGFSLGFLGVLKLHDQFQFLFTPKVGFYGYRTDVTLALPNTGRFDVIQANTEASMVEFPVMFRYKSQRFNNSRMFVSAGATPMFRTQSQDDANLDDLVILGKDITIDVSMGFDLYFKYFKFSPEIKFSHGLNNIYVEEFSNPLFNRSISELRRKTISIIFNFQ